MHPLTHIDGQIERRLLVNLRVEPDAARRVLPPGLRPVTVHGWAVAGLCLIRLGDLRPPFLPRRFGLTTENVAHRIAVEWDEAEGTRTGVWIPSRLTSSRLTALAGGRLFPAVHERATFAVRETSDEVAIEVSQHGRTNLAVACRRSMAVTPGGLFASVADAATFFRAGPVGRSPARRSDHHDVVDLAVPSWELEPFEILAARSSYFDANVPGEKVWDSAFVMRNVSCAWRATTAHVARAMDLAGSTAR